MTPEGAVKAAIKKMLARRGVWYYMPSQNGFGVKGIPDFLGCANEQFFAIEAKAGKGRATLLQQMTIDKIHNANGAVFIINEHNQQEFQTWINQQLNQKS